MPAEVSSFSRERRLDLAPWLRHGPELADVWARVSALLAECQLGSPEPEFLFSISHSLAGRGAIVEIGTNVGTSLLMLASAQRLRHTGQRVTTVDLFRRPELDESLDSTGLRDHVDVRVAPSSEVAAAWAEPVELLWIDGDHSRAGCFTDIETWSRFVIRGGLIALHDYADGMGVPLAVHGTLLARPWQYRVVSDRDYGNIVVFEKIADDPAEPWTDRMTPVWDGVFTLEGGATSAGEVAAEPSAVDPPQPRPASFLGRLRTRLRRR